VDEEFFLAMKQNDGDKTWLGIQFGFKGAIYPIKDLHKNYGSYFIAAASSVRARGTAGIYQDMMFNYIKSYLLGETIVERVTKDNKETNVTKSVIPAEKQKYFNGIKDILEARFKDSISDDGILNLDKTEVSDHMDAINEALEKKFPELLNDRHVNGDPRKLWYALIVQDLNGRDIGLTTKMIMPRKGKETISYADIGEDVDMNKLLELRDIATDTSEGSYVLGYTYVFGDNEHSTKSMQTIAKVNAAGNITYTLKDNNESTLGGFPLTPTVMYSMLHKVSEKQIFSVFPPETRSVQQLAEIRARGFIKYVHATLNVNERDEFNLEEQSKKLLELYQSEQIHEYVYQQAIVLLSYYNEQIIARKNNDNETLNVLKIDVDLLETQTQKEIQKKLFDGTNSAVYRSHFRRHPGFRSQYLADVRLKPGEIVVSKEAWEYATREDAKFKDNDPRKRLRTINKSSGFSEAERIEVLKEIESVKGYHKEYRLDLLRQRGLLEKNNEALWNVVKNDEAMKTFNTATFVDGLARTYLYVLAARSPVQDTDAVPVFRVIGYSEVSYAARVNVYNYNMMGADNDGDTFGMALLTPKDVEDIDSPLRALLATNYNYYSIDEKSDDKGITNYLLIQNEELIGKDVKIVDDVYRMPMVDTIDYGMGRNYTGKNTFNRNIRPDGSYRMVELYSILDKDLYEQLRNAVIRNNLVKSIDKLNESALKTLINMYARMFNDGNDITNVVTRDVYFDAKKRAEFILENKDELTYLYSIEEAIRTNKFVYGKDVLFKNKTLVDVYTRYLNETDQIGIKKNDKKALKNVLEYAIYDKAMRSTIGRVRVSKNGVNYAGGKRKDQMTSSHMAMYPHINKSKQGYFWKEIGATTPTGEVTIVTLMQSLFYAKGKHVSREQFINFIKGNRGIFKSVDVLKAYIMKNSTNTVITNPPSNMKFYMQDLDLILKDLIEITDKYFSAEKELQALYNLMTSSSISNKQYIDFITNSSKIEDSVLSTYVNALRTLPENDKVKQELIDELVMYYFTDNVSAKAFLKKGYHVMFSEGYLDQFLIERTALNRLSALIQETISLAKHGGQDQNPVTRAKAYYRKVDAATTERSIRKLIMGTGLEHIIGRAINVDRNMVDKMTDGPEGDTLGDLNKRYYDENSSALLRLEDAYTDAGMAVQAITNFINERGKLILFGHMYIPKSIMNEVYENLGLLNKALANYTDLRNAESMDDLEQAINYFTRMGIPFYKLIRFVKDAASIKQYIALNYQEVTNNTLDIHSNHMTRKIKHIYAFGNYLKDESFKTQFDSKYKDDILINNFFNNVNDLDDTLIVYDAEGNRRSVYLNDFDGFELELDVKSDIHPVLYNKIKDNLEYTEFTNQAAQYKNLMDELIQEYYLLFKGREVLDQTFKDKQMEIKNRRLLTRAQVVAQNRRVKNLMYYELIGNELKDITKRINEQRQKNIDADTLRTNIFNLEKRIAELRQMRTHIENNIEGYSQEGDFERKINSELDTYNEQLRTVDEQAMNAAIQQHIGNGILYLQDQTTGIIADSTVKKPRYLTEEDDIKPFKNNALLTMTSHMTLLKNMVDNSSIKNKKMSLKFILEFIKTQQQDYRLVVIQKAEEDEGLYKKALSYVRKYDANIDDTLFAERQKRTDLIGRTLDNLRLIDNSKIKELQFNTIDDLVRWQEEGGKVVFNGKVYEGILDPVKLFGSQSQLMPTYKEIRVTNVKELEALYDDHMERGTLVGFVDQNTWMQTMEQVYDPIKAPNRIDQFMFRLQVASKNLSKFSAAFLFRNLTDTVNQLFSNASIYPSNITLQKYWHMTMNSLELYNHYQRLSEEHTLAIVHIGTHYKDLLAHIEAGVVNREAAQNKINLILEMLDSYIKIGATFEESSRITYRSREAASLYRKLSGIDISKLKDYKTLLQQSVAFIADLKFGEFVDMYDNRMIGGKWVAGLRVDSRDKNGNIIPHKMLKETIKDYALKERLIKQLSAFMNTAATADYLRQDRFRLLPKMFETYKGYTEPDETRSYEQLEDMLKDADKRMGTLMDSNIFMRTYNHVNTWIENAARITNFFYNMELYGMSFDSSVRDSLKHWFNYGQRSPLETRLLTDMPFVSFPLRSINNWLDRTLNPRYWRLLSDFIDGWYGQYMEEDNTYNDYMKYQIGRGWLPVADNFGIRIGSGAFDVMNIIYNTQQTLEERRSPLLRGISKLVETGNLTEAMKQFASFGFIGRVTNAITGTADMVFNTELRAGLADSPVAGFVDTRKATLGNTYRGFLYDINSEYSKFTPNRYRYGRNGRYQQYENIYRDWFTKYGKMRKPTVNPMSLVKTTQWRTYVRYRRWREMQK
jgi:hypothetical protein